MSIIYLHMNNISSILQEQPCTIHQPVDQSSRQHLLLTRYGRYKMFPSLLISILSVPQRKGKRYGQEKYFCFQTREMSSRTKSDQCFSTGLLQHPHPLPHSPRIPTGTMLHSSYNYTSSHICTYHSTYDKILLMIMFCSYIIWRYYLESVVDVHTQILTSELWASYEATGGFHNINHMLG